MRAGSSTTAAATTGPAKRAASGLVAARHREDAALHRRAFTAERRADDGFGQIEARDFRGG